jgi:membrane protein
VVTVLFAAIFRFLPDAKVRWREVWIGAAFTALLFEIGKFLLGFYLGRESTASAYGAAASVVLVLLWIYYASLILLFGAEFTQAHARALGHKIEPSEHAVPVTAEARAQEGLTGDPHGRRGETANVEIEPPRESPRAVLHLPKTLPSAGGETPPTTTDFVRHNPAIILMAALGGGFAFGLALRHLENQPDLTPSQQIKEGSKALAFAGVAALASHLSRLRAKTRRSLRDVRIPAIPKEATASASQFIESLYNSR